MLKNELANSIKNAIYEDFSFRFVSGNLKNTLEIVSEEKDVLVRVPAVRYDTKEWNKNNVIVLQPQEGSYANAVDVYGGWSRTHQNYIDRAIFKAIRQVFPDENAIEIEVR